MANEPRIFSLEIELQDVSLIPPPPPIVPGNDSPGIGTALDITRTSGGIGSPVARGS